MLRQSLCIRVPPPLPRRNDRLRTSLASPVIAAFPVYVQRSASALFFSRLARRSLHVAARVFAEPPKWPFSIEGFGRLVTSTTAPIATGGATVAGWVYPPLRDHAFSRRTRSRIRYSLENNMKRHTSICRILRRIRITQHPGRSINV